MMSRGQDWATFSSVSEGDARESGWLTWIGLLVAAIGWALLLGEATVADLLVIKIARVTSPTFHGDLVEIAKCLIGSGFGLAILGGLLTGFGALNRFFGAVLTRSSQRHVAATPPASPIVAHPEPSEHRPYRLLPDGSVEVETILGTRRFETMSDARDFI